MLEALLIRKLFYFNPSAGQWGLADLTTSSISKTLPRHRGLDPLPGT